MVIFPVIPAKLVRQIIFPFAPFVVPSRDSGAYMAELETTTVDLYDGLNI